MNLYKKYRPSTLDEVVGNKEVVSSLQQLVKKKAIPQVILFTGPTGCVDMDTEFLSPTGWKRICEWKDELVMQYNEDGTSEFVKPLHFIKNKKKHLYHIKTKYGIDQCLSKNHRFVYFSKRNNLMVDSFENVLKINEKNKCGFNGKIKTVFTPKITTKLDLTDAQLMVQVMYIADGTLPKNRKKACVNLKKVRKIKRAEILLKNAGIEYDKYFMANDYVRFYFIPPIREKEFSNLYYQCSLKQLHVITDEVFNWDGSVIIGMQVSTTSVQTVDFLQYAFASCGIRTGIYADIREGRNGAYTISCTERIYTSVKQSKPENKVEVQKYKTKDGYEYCFTVPSSYLVLRRNNKIFITGNCGKTTTARILANELGAVESLTEMDSAQFTGIDVIRDIRKKSRFIPIGGGAKVFIMDELHQLSSAAQEGFLKELEDTPKGVYYFLCTTNPEKLKSTLKGRCIQYQLELLSDKDMLSLLESVVKKEKEEVHKKVYKSIVSNAKGHPRNALNILEQVLSVSNKKRLKIAENYELEESESILLCRSLLKNEGYLEAQKILKGLKNQNAESIRRHVLAYCQSVLLGNDWKGSHQSAAQMLEEFSAPTYDMGFVQIVVACYAYYHSE